MMDNRRKTKVYRHIFRKILFKKLGEYSQKIYDEIDKKYPQLIRKITTHPDKHFGGEYIQFIFKSPYNNNIRNILFLTDTNMITVGTDKYHCHFDNLLGLDYKTELVEAMNTIKKIQIEEFVLVYCYDKKNEISMSTMTSINDAKTLETNLRKQYSKIEIVSWNGTFNKLMYAL